MLSGHLLHPEYLQPLPAAPVSPIELDAKKSPLALLAQTCSQIGKSGPPSPGRDCRTSPLKICQIGAEDRSSFQPYCKSPESRDSSAEKSAARAGSAICRPDTPRSGTGSPSSSSGSGRAEAPRAGRRSSDTRRSSSPEKPDSTADSSKAQEVCRPEGSVLASSSSSSSVASPVSPFRPAPPVFPVYPSAYAAFAQPSVVSSKPSAASVFCRDPFCFSFCRADPSYPLMYARPPLRPLYPLYPLLSADPQACSGVCVDGACGKHSSSSEELLLHLQTHPALEKLRYGGAGGAPHAPPALRNTHPALGARFHPYKSPFYPPYTLSSALGYQ